MGLGNWLRERKDKKLRSKLDEAQKTVEAYELGKEYADSIVEKLVYFETRCGQVRNNYVEVFKGRMETIFDEEEHDPATVAEVEFEILGDNVLKLQEKLLAEFDDLFQEDISAMDEMKVDPSPVVQRASDSMKDALLGIAEDAREIKNAAVRECN